MGSKFTKPEGSQPGFFSLLVSFKILILCLENRHQCHNAKCAVALFIKKGLHLMMYSILLHVIEFFGCTSNTITIIW